jgi:dolichyl-phosphate-mannose--protein O-mannosyl transferase
MNMLKAATSTQVIMLLALAFLLRAWGVADVKGFFADESLKIPASENYVATGHVEPEVYFHPSMKFIFFHSGIVIFGNNPYGWRLLNVLFGALSVAVLYAVGMGLFRDKRVAFLAALGLAIDPLHIAQSRTALEEIFVGCFILAALYFLIRYVDGDRSAVYGSGMFLGLSVAMKWYALPVLAISPLFCLMMSIREHDWKWMDVVDVLLAFIALPICIYLLGFYAWFGRGYALDEFLRMQIDAYRELQTLTTDRFSQLGTFAIPSPALWFLKPVFYGFHYAAKGIWSQYHVDMNNFVVWLLGIPSVAYYLHRALRAKDPRLWIFLAWFAATYLQFLFVRRPLFIYSMLVVLPFVLLSVSNLVVAATDRLSWGRRAYMLLIVMTILWGAYMYPLVVGWFVPDALYSPLLAFGHVLE